MFFKNRKLFILKIVLILSLLGGMFNVVPVVQASTLTVTNANENGAGSLRQAIADAVSGDTITFDSSLAEQTITLASTLVIDKDLTIDGSELDSKIAISGNNSVRVLEISPEIIVSLHSLIIKNGYSNTDGGGIYNRGSLTVINSIFSKNSAASYGGGIFNTSSPPTTGLPPMTI